MKAIVALTPGDGIGPEVVNEGRLVLEAVAKRHGHQFKYSEHLLGGCAIDARGTALPSETLAAAKAADAVLLGAVGGPKWDDPQATVRPEQGLLAIRQALGLYANVRPVRPYPALAKLSPLKPEHVAGVDFVVIRELTGGLYFGTPKGRTMTPEGERAVDTLVYTEREIRRIVKLAFQMAQKRRQLVTSVDKANVLGDILTDEAAVLAGSLGVLPSASLGDGRLGLYEPIHGSAPDIAGKGIANPVGTILSVALLLRHSLGLEKEAGEIENAVNLALEEGKHTADLGAKKPLSTTQMGEAVRERLDRGDTNAARHKHHD